MRPNSPDAYRERGRLRGRRNELELAVADFSAALRLNDNDAEARRLRGLAYSYLKNHDAAIADYTELIRRNRKDATSFASRGLVRMNKGEHAEAVLDYDTAISLDPKSAAFLRGRAEVHRRMKQYDKAFNDVNEAVRLNPREKEISPTFIFGGRVTADFAVVDADAAYSYFMRGQLHFEKKQYRHAIRDYTSAILLNPKVADFYRERSRACAATGDRQNAALDLEEANRIQGAGK